MKGVFKMADVELINVTKSFDKEIGIEDLSLQINDGEFVVLLGPTGAGKTTTLRCIAGLEKPDSGEVLIDGQNVVDDSPAQRDVAMVFQQYSLYPHLTVRENLEFPLKSPILNTPVDVMNRKVNEVAEVLRISHKLGNKATELSGGEMQRVSMGRALVRNPRIFLMDEPLSSLDAKLRGDLRVELKRIQAELGATILYVTHDQTEAMTMATQIGVLNNGRLEQFGTPRDIYENPSSQYVATRLGSPRINTLPVSVFGGAPLGATLIGLRPEHIELGSGQDCEVTRIEHLGDQTRLHLRLDDHDVITLTDAHTPIKVGDVIGIAPNNPIFFDASGARVV
jgi:multiple sugar transport system ATP-binding protein